VANSNTRFAGKVAVSWLKIVEANNNPTILSHETGTLPILPRPPKFETIKQ